MTTTSDADRPNRGLNLSDQNNPVAEPAVVQFGGDGCQDETPSEWRLSPKVHGYFSEAAVRGCSPGYPPLHDDAGYPPNRVSLDMTIGRRSQSGKTYLGESEPLRMTGYFDPGGDLLETEIEASLDASDAEKQMISLIDSHPEFWPVIEGWLKSIYDSEICCSSLPDTNIDHPTDGYTDDYCVYFDGNRDFLWKRLDSTPRRLRRSLRIGPVITVIVWENKN